MTTQPMRILSLGAGVQSTALLLMMIHGEIPKADAVIFADTGWEPAAVYKHLEKLEVLMAEHNIRNPICDHASLHAQQRRQKVYVDASMHQRLQN